MIDCGCFLFSMASPAPVADLHKLHRSGDASYIAFVETGKTARRTRGLALVQEQQQLRSCLGPAARIASLPEKLWDKEVSLLLKSPSVQQMGRWRFFFLDHWENGNWLDQLDQEELDTLEDVHLGEAELLDLLG